MTGLADVAIVTTAWKRPYYLEQTLASWERARGIEQAARFCIMLGMSGRYPAARAVIDEFAARVPFDVHLHTDEGNLGPWRTNADGMNFAFADPAVNFAVIAEEDILVADDVLELLAWGRGEFAVTRPCWSSTRTPAAGRAGTGRA